ncbi:MAG: hypothetical protein IJO71_01985 [Microbacterium sp.]|uniref:hypothetical protein n=1 Tax=Microbacterium sp. TaxID=51671 RepID=UPI0025DF6C2C|nr:hypothetical protein [Microbacterium sp.]MBQ9915951.1 hypothetical protein [Microbacterium sp.]
MNKRALLICRYDNWPDLTPDRLWQLPAHMWPQLALACDEIAKQRADEADELRRMRR